MIYNKYNKREDIILAQGMYFGVGATFIGVGVTQFFNIPVTTNGWIYGIILGTVFLVWGHFFGGYILKHETETPGK